MINYKLKLNREELLLIWLSFPISLSYFNYADLEAISDIDKNDFINLLNKIKDNITSEDFHVGKLTEDGYLYLNISEMEKGIIMSILNNSISNNDGLFSEYDSKFEILFNDLDSKFEII